MWRYTLYGNWWFWWAHTAHSASFATQCPNIKFSQLNPLQHRCQTATKQHQATPSSGHKTALEPWTRTQTLLLQNLAWNYLCKYKESSETSSSSSIEIVVAVAKVVSVVGFLCGAFLHHDLGVCRLGGGHHWDSSYVEDQTEPLLGGRWCSRLFRLLRFANVWERWVNFATLGPYQKVL